MAVDEALLESSARDNRLTLRFYQWNEPTLSLGYFQRYEDRRQHRPSLALACVRRSTGGGAILHDRELTYSIVVPQSHPLGHNAQQLYDAMHNSLIACLRDYGIRDLSLASEPGGSELFLCFQRRAIGDLLLSSHKIAGSAQRRRQGAVLQHGSILLWASSAASELPGINDLAGCSLTADELAARWQLPFALLPAELLPEERLHATKLVQARFSNVQWTQRR